MKEKIMKVLRGPLLSSVIYVALGLSLILLPSGSINVLCKVVFGVVMIGAGLYHVLLHVMDHKNATFLDLFSGVILTVFGGYLFMNPLLVINLIPVILGALVLADSIWTLRAAYRLKQRSRGSWKILAVGCLVFIALGVVMIVNPFKVRTQQVIFDGSVLLANGIADYLFWGMLFFGIRHADKEEQNQQEAEEKENKWSAGKTGKEDQPAYEEWSSSAPEIAEKPADAEPVIEEEPEHVVAEIVVPSEEPEENAEIEQELPVLPALETSVPKKTPEPIVLVLPGAETDDAE
ncbi:MAG: DUF308 domain-containing protein [Clostridiales bacterium]|nr:DUF308 domain-containing protein [Candidatus Blautia equi]